MKLNRLFAFSIPLLMLAIAPCSWPVQPPEGGKEGLMIQEFSAPSEVMAGETFSLRLELVNKGEIPAKDVKIDLDLPLGFEVEEKPQIFEIQPGEKAELEWLVRSQAIEVPEMSFEPFVRVTYPYETSAEFSIGVVSAEFLAKLPPGERKKMEDWTGVKFSRVSKGPFSIALEVSKPLVVRQGRSFPLKVRISNIGGGIPSFQKEKYGAKIEELEAEAPLECKPKEGEIIRLIEGREKVVYCYLKLGKVEGKTEIILRVKLSYDYLVYKSTSMKLIKPY